MLIATMKSVILASDNSRCGSRIIKLLLNQDKPIVTQELLEAVLRRTDYHILVLMLGKWDNLEITAAMVLTAEREHASANKVRLLLITEETMLVAVTKHSYEDEIVSALLGQCRNNRITEPVLLGAASKGSREAMRLLLEHGNTIPVTETVIKRLAANDHNGLEVMELLLSRGSANEVTEEVVKVVATSGRDTILEMMSDKCNLNAPRARWMNVARLHNGAENGKGDMVQSVIISADDVDMPDSEGQTPLFKVSRGGHEGVVEPLLAPSGDRMRRAMMATHHWPAASTLESGMIKMLLESGANVLVKTRKEDHRYFRLKKHKEPTMTRPSPLTEWGLLI